MGDGRATKVLEQVFFSCARGQSCARPRRQREGLTHKVSVTAKGEGLSPRECRDGKCLRNLRHAGNDSSLRLDGGLCVVQVNSVDSIGHCRPWPAFATLEFINDKRSKQHPAVISETSSHEASATNAWWWVMSSRDPPSRSRRQMSKAETTHFMTQSPAFISTDKHHSGIIPSSH